MDLTRSVRVVTEAEDDTYLVVVAPRSDVADAVIDLSKTAQATLGQLPYSAFHQAAANGTLLAAVSAGRVLGYALYRIRKRSGVVMLTQLCVDPQARGRGVADSLIQGVVDRNPLCPGVGLWCREDSAATAAWPALGFGSTGSKRGRSDAGHRLVHWWRVVAEMTLFTFDADEEDIPAVALDANVFRDIHEPRPEFRSSLALIDDWLIDVVEFVVTPQLETEIEEASRTVSTLVGKASWYRRLSPDASVWRSELDQLKPLLQSPDIRSKDQRHVAQAVAGGARYFVTRDEGILAHVETIEESTGLTVISPDDLLLHLHADQFDVAYRPEVILETTASLIPLHEIPDKQALTSFVVHDLAEKAGDLQKVFKAAAASVTDGWQQWAISGPSGELLALAVFQTFKSTLSVAVLRVRRGPDRTTFARQLIHLLRREAVRANATRFEILDHAPEYLADSLRAEGLAQAGDRWAASCQAGVFDLDSTIGREAIDPSLRGENRLSRLVSEAERSHWPAKFAGADVPTYVVPIQASWARALFDSAPPQGELFERSMSLGLAREHVYYRSYRKTVDVPARLIWYVSGKGSNRGFRAVSWLDEVVSDRPGSLFQRYGARGIYAAENVQALVRNKGGKATAMLFSRTEVFDRSITLRRARELVPEMNQNGYLRTMRSVSEHVFYDFYAEAFQ